METTLKQQVLTQITALPESASFEEILHILRALRPKKLQKRHVSAMPDKIAEQSCFELMRPYIGCFEGTEDLSTNKAYMEGFGQ